MAIRQLAFGEPANPLEHLAIQLIMNSAYFKSYDEVVEALETSKRLEADLENLE